MRPVPLAQGARRAQRPDRRGRRPPAPPLPGLPALRHQPLPAGPAPGPLRLRQPARPHAAVPGRRQLVVRRGRRAPGRVLRPAHRRPDHPGLCYEEAGLLADWLHTAKAAGTALAAATGDLEFQTDGTMVNTWEGW